MNREFLAQLAEIQTYATGLQRLVAEAQASTPDRAEGKDRTGMVTVVLGPDGMPDRVRVDERWDRELKPEAFGGAVLEAAQAAAGQRMTEWTRTLQDDGWQDKADRLEHDAARSAATADAGIPPALRKRIEQAKPRPMGDLAEAMMKAFDGIGRPGAHPAPPAEAVGEAVDGKVRLTLGPAGLVSCTTEPRWTADQTAARLMNALGQAISDARRELDELAAEPPPATGLDRLLADALAMLGNPSRLANS